MFDHVKFGVSDYAASKAFFLKALEPLGVTVVSEWPPNGVALSQPTGNVSLCLYQTEEKPAVQTLTDRARRACGSHILVCVRIPAGKACQKKLEVKMFRVTRTQHVLAVNDLDASEHYFTEKLGFNLRSRIDGWLFLTLDNFHLMVGHCAGETPARETNNHSWFAYVNCEGVDELYNEYTQRGVEFTQKISSKPWGLREFGVVTPEGHRIVFGQEL